MIDLKAVGSGANGTMAVLPRVQRLDVGDGEGAAVVLLARSVGGEVDARHCANMRNVFALPLFVSGLHFLWMLFTKALHFGTMAGRILCSAPLGASSHVAGVASVPSFCFGDRASNARTVGSPSLIVALWARLTAVVAFAGGAGCNTIRMLWRSAFSKEANSFLPVAQDAISTSRPSIKQVPVSARFAGIVSGLARGFRSGSLWHGSHTFTVIRFA